MADANTSLPVRTQNPGDVIVKLSDATTPSQQAAVTAAGELSVINSANGALSGGTAGTTSLAAGGVYHLVALTLTDGQQASLQLDAAANLKVVLATGTNTIGAVTQGTTPWVDNIAQFGGTAVSLGQKVMASSMPVVIASDQTAIPVTQSTTPWITRDNADGAVSGGTAGTFSSLSGLIYNSTPLTLTNGQQASLQGDVNGYLKVDLATPLPAGTNSIGTVVVSNFPTTLDTNYGTVGASTLRTAAQIGNATGAADFNNGATGAQTLRTAANLAVGGANVSLTNPVPVTVTSATPGTAIQEYHTSAALAAGSSVTFTYTVVATHTFSLERAWASASGKIKAVLINNGATIMVGFNSTATPNIDMTIMAPPTVAAGNTVQITITNDDILPFDVYATIEGNQN